MFLKNESQRLIKINLKGKESLKVIPTKSAVITEAQVKEIKLNKVYSAWLKDGDITITKEPVKEDKKED